MPRDILRLVVGAALALACEPPPAAAPAKAARAQEARVVEVAAARPSPHPRILTLSGTLAPLEKVQVAARVEGPITEVRVDLGDRVTKDQVLATIRPVDYRARVAELDAALSQATSDVRRIESLGGVATAEELELARTRLSEAKAQRSLASRQLTDTSVRAAFAGAIAARHAAPGTYVKPGAPLFDLVADDTLRLTLEVPERYAALVVPGTPVEVAPKDMMAGQAGAPLAATAKVTRLSPVVSPATRTFTAEAEVPRDAVLRPGMFVVAKLALGHEERSVRVPRASVFHVLGRDRVMQVRDGEAAAQDVELLAEEGGDAIVTGLDAGATVIVRGAATVAPGTLVRPAAPKDAASRDAKSEARSEVKAEVKTP